MKKCLSISIASVLALSAPGIANATLSVTAEVGGIPTVSGATLETFDEATPPSILTLSGSAALVTGTDPDNIYMAPVFSGSEATFFGESVTDDGYDASQYVAVFPNDGSATLKFSTPQNYLGLLWGSVGQGNVLAFYDSAGNPLGTISGSDVDALFDNGYPSTGTAYVNITSTTAFAKVVATDSNDAFEFDDVAYAQIVVPEPTTVIAGVLLLLPFGAGTLRMLRKSRAA